jgi:hypothetical protein
VRYDVAGEYIIGTGYYRYHQEAEDFLRDIWMRNTVRYAEPERIIITNAASPSIKLGHRVHWLNLMSNPEPNRRHRIRLMQQNADCPAIPGGRFLKFGGWSLGFIHGALYAYSCGRDYIYKEQDCLAFGNWVERMYRLQAEKDCGMLTGELRGHPMPGLVMEICLVFVTYKYNMPFLSSLFAV